MVDNVAAIILYNGVVSDLKVTLDSVETAINKDLVDKAFIFSNNIYDICNLPEDFDKDCNTDVEYIHIESESYFNESFIDAFCERLKAHTLGIVLKCGGKLNMFNLKNVLDLNNVEFEDRMGFSIIQPGIFMGGFICLNSDFINSCIDLGDFIYSINELRYSGIFDSINELIGDDVLDQDKATHIYYLWYKNWLFNNGLPTVKYPTKLIDQTELERRVIVPCNLKDEPERKLDELDTEEDLSNDGNNLTSESSNGDYEESSVLNIIYEYFERKQ